MKIAVLTDVIRARSQSRPEGDAKEDIASKLGAENIITKADEVRRFKREIQKDK